MNTMTSRISKILTGSFLIGLTLASAGTDMSYEMLFSLVAIPMIFSGMFDWRPLEYGFAWIARSIPFKVDDVSFTAKRTINGV